MSGPTGTTAEGAPPTIIVKNDYFTYTGSHREPEQVWNEGGITIQVQGTCPPGCTGAAATFFAKKHLLTFKGGKMSGQTGKTSDNKMKKMVDTRIAGQKTPKYGNTRLPSDKPNTFIICDNIEPAKLRKAFADALKATRKSSGEIEISFPTDCVVNYDVNGAKTSASKCKVQFWKNPAKAEYVILHMKGLVA
jgi:hypothetical protein